MTFEDFLACNPVCAGCEGNPDAIAIFELLSKDENIAAMIEMSEAGGTALSACVEQIEDRFENQEDPALDLGDEVDRETVSRMVRCILEPFGYKASGLAEIGNSKYFESASWFTKQA